MTWKLAGAALVLVLGLPAAALAQVERQAPIGAYPSGTGSDGRAPIGAYPPARPAPINPPSSAESTLPPALADQRADYCARHPEVCNTRQPETPDMIIDQQKAFEERLRRMDEELRLSRKIPP